SGRPQRASRDRCERRRDRPDPETWMSGSCRYGVLSWWALIRFNSHWPCRTTISFRCLIRSEGDIQLVGRVVEGRPRLGRSSGPRRFGLAIGFQLGSNVGLANLAGFQVRRRFEDIDEAA